MSTKTITQKQMAFYKLLEERKKDQRRYVATWEFVGEMYISQLNTWVMMSYKCPTRLTDLFQENPKLLERTEIQGKSGATYFAYRIREGGSRSDIEDPTLLNFLLKIKSNENNTKKA